MGCSDTMAQMLEERDPHFRQRNEYNRDVDSLVRSYSAELCAWGEAMHRGDLPAVAFFQDVHDPVENKYVRADVETSEFFGTKTSAQLLHEAVAASYAAVELIKNDGDGKAFFAWLHEHWERDARYLRVANERHQRELATKRGEKLEKRRQRLLTDVPEQARYEELHNWAASKL